MLIYIAEKKRRKKKRHRHIPLLLSCLLKTYWILYKIIYIICDNHLDVIDDPLDLFDNDRV